MANISYRVTKRVDIIVGGSKEYDEKSKHHSHTSSSSYTEGYLGANIKSNHECPEGHKDYDYEILPDVSESDESCIVVGGSPSILEYGLGEKIDSFDRVIRVNSCPVKGIESHVGSKTNIWVTSLTMQKCLDEKRWGKLFFPNQLDEIIIAIKKSKNNFISVSSKEKLKGMINIPLILLSLLVLISLEWFLRKYNGLI